MAKRTAAKPLYELMLPKRDQEPRSGDASTPQRPSRIPSPDQLIGRTIRVPMGYLLLATGGVLLLLAVAYMVGYWRADRAVKDEYDRRYLEANSGGRIVDPLHPGGVDTDPEVAPEAGVQRPPIERSTPVVARPEQALPALEWGPLESEPRQRGRYYLVLAETRPDGARRLAEFCRSRELAAYVVNGNNATTRRVIVLPGFDTRSRSDQGVRLLLDKIDRIGTAWKSEHRGESDLKDAYMRRY